MPIRTKSTSVWDDFPELSERLKDMHAAGYSAAQIARDLGHAITRTAVISKASRMRLPQRKAGSLPQAKPKPYRVTSSRIVHAVPSEPKPLGTDGGSRITILTVSARNCRWPIGDPRDSGFHFCGHPPKPGRSYCPAHCAKAYAPQHPARRQDLEDSKSAFISRGMAKTGLG